ncbi:MAG TPA: putative glycoside hydrolase [Candidatus Binatia bacterium]|nr:putative glycoside hydrolase [Candidatus Binatia bacterium]
MRGDHCTVRLPIATALVPLLGIASAASGATSALAPTLSGFPSAPRAERALRVRGRGVAIRFRAPVTGTITTAYTYWQRRKDACSVQLAADDDGHPGQTIVDSPLTDASQGWGSVPLHVGVTAGAVYHLVVTCAGTARLGYVLDADQTARRAGAWALEHLGRRGARVRGGHAAPLFALVYDDGRWWGQPYRPVHGRPAIRVCPDRDLTATLTPNRSVAVSDVVVPHHPRVRFALEESDGSAVLASAPPDATRARTLESAMLLPGVRYVLRLRRAHRGHGCFRTGVLMTDLAVGPSVGGLDLRDLPVRPHAHNRADEHATLAITLVGTPAPLATCGDGHHDVDEECDGTDAAACPGRCTALCTCAPETPPPPTCGNGVLDAGETCDGPADDACPGACTAACTCAAAPPARSYRSIYASGYLGLYDPATIDVWPKRLGLMLGEANAQGPLVAPAKVLAAASGNADARFIFYLSLTDMDSRCSCFDQTFYDGFRGAHPEWILKNASGGLVSTNNGIGRLFATDIGNPDYVDAWADYALAAADRWGWDGTFVDNVFRGYFDSWSATPVNPRTGKLYTTAQYRADILAAVQRLRARFDARGKFLIGNHTSAWDPATFADPVTKDEVLALGGVEIEDCIFDWNGNPHTEAEWIAQLAYLDFATRHGVRTVCSSSTEIGRSPQRDYILASYLLSKEGFSSVSELNSLGDWWSGLAADLGAPRGGYTCLDPGQGLAPTTSCPSPGKIYAREWERGRVLVNPSAGATVDVPVGTGFLLAGSPVTHVTLGPQRGVVLVHR